MLAELSQGRSCGQTARGGRGTVCRVEFSYRDSAAVTTSLVRGATGTFFGMSRLAISDLIQGTR